MCSFHCGLWIVVKQNPVFVIALKDWHVYLCVGTLDIFAYRYTFEQILVNAGTHTCANSNVDTGCGVPRVGVK